MLYISVTSVGSDLTYKCNDDFSGLVPVSLEDPPLGQKKYSFSAENMLALSSGDDKNVVIYDNNLQKMTKISFEKVFLASVCTTDVGLWYFLAAENNVVGLYSFKADSPPVRLMTVPDGYQAMTVSKTLGKVILLSYKGKKVLTVDPIRNTAEDIDFTPKPKFETGLACDGRGFIYYYNNSNELVKTDLNGSTNTPLWQYVGGTEYTPVGSPTVDYYGNIYCACSEGFLLKYSPDLEFLGKLSVAGLNNVSHDAFLLDTAVLTKPDDQSLGDIPVGYNNLEFTIDLEISSKLPYLEVSADSGVILSPDGVVWGTTAEFYNIEPADYSKLYVRLSAPGIADFIKNIMFQSCFMDSIFTVALNGKGVAASEIVVPIAAYSSVAGSVEKRVMIRRVQPSSIEKSIDVKADFVT